MSREARIWPMTVLDAIEYDQLYALAFKAGAETTQAAASAMLERAKQPVAALGVSLMKLPEPPK